MTDSDGMFSAPHPCWLGELASCLSVVFQDTQPPQKAHPNTLPWSRESCTLHLCSQRATFQKDKAYLKTVWGFSRASICCFFFFFNKANKEKYYFALLIFFFLLCVYVRAFERAVGYVAQTGPLAALLGFMVLSHRSTGLRPWLGGYRCLWRPEVGVGWVPSSVTVEAEVGVGWVSSFVTVHLLWRQGPSWNLASADSHELLVSKLWDPPVPPELRF